MKTIKQTILCSFLLLITVQGMAQAQSSDFAIEIKSKNPKYRKINLTSNYLERYEMKRHIHFTEDSRSPNSGKYTYLYEAYVQYVPDAQGNAKEQILWFFSDYNINFKRKSSKDKPKSDALDGIIADMDKNPFIQAETLPDTYLEVSEHANDSDKKIKVFATETYIYDKSTLHPNKKPIFTGKRFQYKYELRSHYKYETDITIDYNNKGKATGLTEWITKEGGRSLILNRVEQLDENGKLKNIHFSGYLGMDIISNEVYSKVGIHIPSGVEKQWPTDLRKFNTTHDLLGDIRRDVGIEPIEDKEQLKEFLTNFQKLNEYVFIDPTEKNVHQVPKKYIYKGTYNKDGMPHGWGLIYAANQFEDEYYLGHFKNGMPDGFGIRHNFKLDRPETVYSSRGMHVGNTMIYGSKTTRPANNYGYNVAYGDFRTGELNGKGSIVWHSGHDNGIGDLYFGYFQDGKLHGEGNYYTNSRKQAGIFANGSFVEGDEASDKINDFRYAVGSVVLYKGKKYVIMKKANGNFHLDWIVVPGTADLTLTGERSMQSHACNICGGKGYFGGGYTTNTVFSGVTKTSKSYEVGTTGYVTWEKTTTTTTAPVTATSYSSPTRCSCSGGTISEPKAINLP